MTYFNHENKLCSELNTWKKKLTEAPAKNQEVQMRLTKSKKVNTPVNFLGVVDMQLKGWTSSFQELDSESSGGGVTPDISVGLYTASVWSAIHTDCSRC